MSNIRYVENGIMQDQHRKQKIEINPKQSHFIKTIRGKGYKLVCEEL